MSLVEWASTGSEATQRLNIKNPTEIRMNFCRIFFLHIKRVTTTAVEEYTAQEWMDSEKKLQEGAAK